MHVELPRLHSQSLPSHSPPSPLPVPLFQVGNGILQQYIIIQVINYIRSQVELGLDPSQIKESLQKTPYPWHDEAYLRPVLPNDELLFQDWEEEEKEEEEEEEESGGGYDKGKDKQDGITLLSSKEQTETDTMLKTLKEENGALRQALQTMQQLVLGDIDDNPDDWLFTPTTTSKSRKQQEEEEEEIIAKANNNATDIQAVDASYFDSYSNLGIHREMLKDTVRTEAYKAALQKNPSLMKNAVVLDVGCGTGVLSMFAAQGGAQRVFSVEASRDMAALAAEIVRFNDLQDVVTVVQGKMEEITHLASPGEGDQREWDGGEGGNKLVDVLVSEWMGYALLFETMLDSVLNARDRFLKPGGAVLPDKATIYAAAATSDALGLDFWNEVYGLKMTPVAVVAQKRLGNDALVQPVCPDHIVSDTVSLKEFDLVTMKPKDQDFTAEFSLTLNTTTTPGGGGGQKAKEMAALVLWFDTSFSNRFCKECPVLLGTGPFTQQTHWVQTILVLNKPIGRGTGGEKVECRVSMVRRSGKHRSLDISVECWLGSDPSQKVGPQMFTMQVSS
jgi:type I protein arginine methyltransferase